MKRTFSTGFAAILCLCLCSFVFSAPKKTIHVTPDNAKIYIDGAEVGAGTYTVKFDRGTDFVMVKLEAPGYITKTYKLTKDNPKKTILYKLPEDEALAASMGGDGEDDGTDIANRWLVVPCRKGLTEDIIWKRLMNIAVKNFEDVEVRDKAAGWIKTRWRTTNFTEQTVRTRLEVRMSFTDEDQISYRVRLESQIKDKDCRGNQCYEKFNYILNKYAPLISELQTSVGGGE